MYVALEIQGVDLVLLGPVILPEIKVIALLVVIKTVRYIYIIMLNYH